MYMYVHLHLCVEVCRISLYQVKSPQDTAVSLDAYPSFDITYFICEKIYLCVCRLSYDFESI